MLAVTRVALPAGGGSDDSASADGFVAEQSAFALTSVPGVAVPTAGFEPQTRSMQRWPGARRKGTADVAVNHGGLHRFLPR